MQLYYYSTILYWQLKKPIWAYLLNGEVQLDQVSSSVSSDKYFEFTILTTFQAAVLVVGKKHQEGGTV